MVRTYRQWSEFGEFDVQDEHGHLSVVEWERDMETIGDDRGSPDRKDIIKGGRHTIKGTLRHLEELKDGTFRAYDNQQLFTRVR